MDMAEHKHGTMNIDVQEKTFAGFTKIVTWFVVATIAVLIFMALVNS